MARRPIRHQYSGAVRAETAVCRADPLTRLRYLRRILCTLLLAAFSLSAAERPRLAFVDDIGGDPDDRQTVIRLMVYANEFDLDLLVASAVRKNHTPNGPTTRPELIREIIGAYGQVLGRGPTFRPTPKIGA